MAVVVEKQKYLISGKVSKFVIFFPAKINYILEWYRVNRNKSNTLRYNKNN